MFFRKITELIVSSFDLLEAEADRLKNSLSQLIVGFIFLFAAMILSLVGVFFIGKPLFFWLSEAIGTQWTYLLAGFILFGAAFGLIWNAKKYI